MTDRHRRGGVIAGLLCTIGILGLLAVAGGLYLADHVRVVERTGRGEATVETPFGNLRVRENSRLDPAALGVPVYPGAIRDENNHTLASFHLDFGGRHKEFAVAAANYRTGDSVDQVANYYRDKLPHWMFSERHRGFELSLKQGGYKKVIAIYRDNDETRIGLASFGNPQSN